MNCKKRLQHQFLGFLNTPNLWEEQSHFPFPQYFLPEQKSLENISEKIKVPEKLPLGKRVEHFFNYTVNATTEEKILLNNIQIKQEKITIGELDFLLKNDKTQKITHVELVYKFYVYDASFENEMERWIGPNRRDSLVQKVEKLQKKQFPLLFKAETAQLLKKTLVNAEEIEQKVCFKAFLFLPKDFSKEKISLVNKECIVGYWLHFTDFNTNVYENQQFFAPVKQDWPINPEFHKNWKDFEAIKEEILHFHEMKKSPLIWMKKNEHEYERFFVVWW